MLPRFSIRAARRKLAALPFRSGLGDSAWLLYGLARSLKPEVCVEIGSARGKSACHVGLALRENGRGKLWAIDPHRATEWNDADSADTYGAIRRNVRSVGLDGWVEIVREDSSKAAAGWSRPIDLLFIDGDHSYDGVKADWDAFARHVRPFGFVAFHDTLWDLRPDPRYARADMGVPRFVEELRRQGYPVLTVDQDYGVSLVQPVKGGQSLGGRPPAGGASEPGS